jgi:hypothetical protein
MVVVANETGEIVLSKQDLREVTGYAAAYLHPLADAHQVKHILGAAAHAARAAELVAGDDRDVGAEQAGGAWASLADDRGLTAHGSDRYRT